MNDACLCKPGRLFERPRISTFFVHPVFLRINFFMNYYVVCDDLCLR